MKSLLFIQYPFLVTVITEFSIKTICIKICRSGKNPTGTRPVAWF